MRKAALFALALFATLPALVTTAQAQRWDGDRDSRRWRHHDSGRELRGKGVRDLFPALRESGRGREFVQREFDFDNDRRVDRREADAANRAFFNLADRNRNGRLNHDEVQHGLNLIDRKHRWQRSERDPYRD